MKAAETSWASGLEGMASTNDAATLDEVVGLKVIRYDTMDGYKFYLDDGGFLLIRFSGTEPIIRVYCETTHGDKVQDILQDGLRIAGLR